METVITRAYNLPSPHPHQSVFDNIAFLEQFEALYLKRDQTNTQGQVVDVQGNFVLNIDMYGSRSRQRRAIGGAAVNFLDRNGQIVFNYERQSFVSYKNPVKWINV